MGSAAPGQFSLGFYRCFSSGLHELGAREVGCDAEGMGLHSSRLGCQSSMSSISHYLLSSCPFCYRALAGEWGCPKARCIAEGSTGCKRCTAWAQGGSGVRGVHGEGPGLLLFL